jgi:ubiquinone/menaquinone biosynthesis C-methylase UbiE
LPPELIAAACPAIGRYRRELLNSEEDHVRTFYDQYGWVKTGATTGEDLLFRDFSRFYYPYHDRVNAKTIDCFRDLHGRLLIGGGGDLPESHVAIAGQFSDVTCLDISRVAVDIARQKLANTGEFIIASLLDIPKPDDYFDAVFCAHVIYHIQRDRQADAVRELIRVSRPGGRIVIIYSNPHSMPERLVRIKSSLPFAWRFRRKNSPPTAGTENRPQLYFSEHPLDWWSQFSDRCSIEIRSWDALSNAQEDQLFFSDAIAACGYRFLSWFERRLPRLAARWWTYPLLVLTKHGQGR